MYEKYFKCIFLLTICIGCKANTIKQLGHASNFKQPQLPPLVKEAFERSAEASVQRHDQHEQHYHHQHYYVDAPTATNGFIEKRKDQIHKPRVGEILVKDSVLYNGNVAPANSQPHQPSAVRRNYWPLVDNTVTSLASQAAAGAAAVKNLLKVGFFSTFDAANAAVEHKKHKIASYLIQAAQEHQFSLQQAKDDEKHKQQLKLAAANLGGGITQQIPLLNQAQPLLQSQLPVLPLTRPLQALLPLKQKLAQNVVQHFSKHLKKPIKKPMSAPWIIYSKTRTLPTTTLSEGYVHTYDNKYMPPNFNMPHERNPYADMGVTSYKHFEDTILKELEEKEERKVEATMHTLLDDQYLLHDSFEGTKPGSSQEWLPFSSHENGLFTSASKPVTVNSFTASTFDRPFNDVRPVCENLDEVPSQPTLFVFPANAETQLNELQEATNENSVKVKLTDAAGGAAQAQTTSNSTSLPSSSNSTTEKPNYPAYFIKQQQELRKLQQKLVGAYRTKSQFGNKTPITPTTTPNRSRGHSPYGRRTTTTTTTTSNPTSTTPISITTDAPLYYFSMNGSDDGFRPMLPSEIKAMKIKKPVRNKLDDTIPSSSLLSSLSVISTTARPRGSSWIQAQASHVHLSVVNAPDTKRNKPTTTRNDIKSSSIRKTPKKNKPGIAGNSTTASTNANKKTYRGALKFSDSVHQSQTS